MDISTLTKHPELVHDVAIWEFSGGFFIYCNTQGKHPLETQDPTTKIFYVTMAQRNNPRVFRTLSSAYTQVRKFWNGDVLVQQRNNQ